MTKAYDTGQLKTTTDTELVLKAPLASPTFTGTVSGITAGMVGAEPVLVSGTTIKTINSTSVLGSGNIVTPDTVYTHPATHPALILDAPLVVDKGSVASGTVTFDVSAGLKQKLTVTGALTIATSTWPTTGSYGELEIELINGGAFAVTLPTVNWLVGDGTTSTTFADAGITLNAAGSNTLVLWSDDAGTTVFGVAG